MTDQFKEWRCICGEHRDLYVRRDNLDCLWHHGDISKAPLAVRVAKRMEIHYTGDNFKRAQQYIDVIDGLRKE